MRDNTIHQMHEANARRNALILGQFEFLKTRQEALERVIKVSTLMDRIRWMVWPADLVALVDAVQINLLAESKRKMQEAAAKPKIMVPTH